MGAILKDMSLTHPKLNSKAAHVVMEMARQVKGGKLPELVEARIGPTLNKNGELVRTLLGMVELSPKGRRHALRVRLVERLGEEFPDLPAYLAKLEPREQGRFAKAMLESENEKVVAQCAKILEVCGYDALKVVMPCALRSKKRSFWKARELFIKRNDTEREGLCDFKAGEILNALGKEWSDAPWIAKSMIGIRKDEEEDANLQKIVDDTEQKIIAILLAPYLKDSVRLRVGNKVSDAMEEFFRESEMTIRSPAGIEFFRLISRQPKQRQEKLFQIANEAIERELRAKNNPGISLIEAIQYLPEKYRQKLYGLGQKGLKEIFSEFGWDTNIGRRDLAVNMLALLPHDMQAGTGMKAAIYMARPGKEIWKSNLGD